MKKQYTLMTIIIAVMVFLLFGGAAFAYTYFEANKAMTEYREYTYMDAEYLTVRPDDYRTKTDMIRGAYSNEWYMAPKFLEDHMGFYEMIVVNDKDYKYSGYEAKSSDYVLLYKLNEENQIRSEDCRVIPVEDDFKAGSRDLMNVECTGDCNDIYVYNFEFSCTDHVNDQRIKYSKDTFDSALMADSTSVAEWVGDDKLYAKYIQASTKEQKQLNEEAEKICRENIEALHNGNVVPAIEDNYLTSYLFVCEQGTDPTGMGEVSAYSVFVYHPLEIVLRDKSFIYIIGLITMLVLEFMVIFMMRKLYKNRLNYESQSQSLTRSITHDLKTPLAVTKAYVENWDYIDDKDKDEYSKSISREIDSMTDMVNDILRMNRLSSDMQKPKLEEVELGSLTKAVYKKIQPLADKRGLKVSINVDEDEENEYLVEADLEMIKTVIGNYISNAVKYAATRISIELVQTSKKVTFRISNDGQQIEKKKLKRVWDAFYKGDEARTNSLGSSGIGLAIVKNILRLHKAKYGCTSSSLETVFWFSMNRIKKDGKQI